MGRKRPIVRACDPKLGSCPIMNLVSGIMTRQYNSYNTVVFARLAVPPGLASLVPNSLTLVLSWWLVLSAPCTQLGRITFLTSLLLDRSKCRRSGLSSTFAALEHASRSSDAWHSTGSQAKIPMGWFHTCPAVPLTCPCWTSHSLTRYVTRYVPAISGIQSTHCCLCRRLPSVRPTRWHPALSARPNSVTPANSGWVASF